MNQPNPNEVKTDKHFWNFAEGLKHGCEIEKAARVFCLAAKKAGRWDMTQKELDAGDSNGSFLWHTSNFSQLVENKDNRYTPTNEFFGRLLKIGLVEITA